MSFTWKPFYKELFLTIVRDYNSKTLADVYYEIFPKVSNENKNQEKEAYHGEIDPCSFLVRFNRKESIEIKVDHCKRAKKALSLKSDIPIDFDGIRIFQNAHPDPLVSLHNKNSFEMNTLWSFSKELSNGEVTKESLHKALKCENFGISILSTLAYMVYPEKYLPINKRTREFLEKRNKAYREMIDEIEASKEPFDAYIKFLKEVAELFPKKSFSEICKEADIEKVGHASKKDPIESKLQISKYEKISYDDETLTHDKLFDHKNIIFWGPPGTGKTYRLLKIREQFKGSKQTDELRLSEFTNNLSWWEALALSIYDKGHALSVVELQNHKFIKEKIEQSNLSKTKPGNILWGNLQNHTVLDSKTVGTKLERRIEPLIFDKTDDKKWNLVGDWKDQLVDLIKEFERFNKGEVEVVEDKRYEIVTFHQSYGYEEFVEGFRPEPSEDNTQMVYQVQDGIFKKLCKRAIKDPEQNYAIFIDEINRGNISKIFGELITLIEADKRLGKDNEIKVRLPYSKEEFGVPKNLYIYGTMNSVDRSIALVDMALRRRFSFKEFRPDSSLIKNSIEGLNFKKIFETLNKRISMVLGTEYQIGHSYFMGNKSDSLSSFKRTWFESILPLLQEYLFDDWERIKAIVGDFVTSSGEVKLLSEVSLPKEEYQLFIKDNVSDEEFLQMMRKLAE